MVEVTEDAEKRSFAAEPLTGEDRPRRRRRRSKRRFRKLRKWMSRYIKPRIIAISLIVILTVGVGSQVILLTDARNQITNSQQNFERVIRTFANKDGTELTLADFDRLESSLNDMSRTIRLTRSRLVFIRPLTALNPDWVAYVDTLDASEALVNAARDMLTGIEPTLFFMVEGQTEEAVVTQISSGERIVELLTIGRGQFLRAQGSLTEARTQLDTVDVSNASAETLLLVEQINAYHGQLVDMNELLLNLPDILTAAFGLEEDASYLILAQNNDEIRPSGGFIGTWGWMTVRNGRVTDFDYSASTESSPLPPQSLNIADEYPIPEWWFRYDRPIFAAWDGSWHADFPQTAEMAAWYYNNGNNPATPVDGVIAIDVTGFEYVLGALERVTVPEYNVVVSRDNFRQVVYEVREEGQHKDFVAEVYAAIFEEWRAVDSDPQVSAAVLGAMLQSVRERHIMVYLADDDLQSAVERIGWSGSQDEVIDHDYLMVVDANVSPNKSNSSIVRQWTYDVTINTDGSLTSRATVDYDYPEALASQDPAVDPRFHGPLDYRNLLQLIVPPNSEQSDEGLEDDVRIIDVVAEDAYTRFVAIFTLEYDSSERVQFSYSTPPLVEQFGSYNRYRLLLQKQPGSANEQITVQVTLPEGAELVSTSPDFATSYTLDQLILDYRVTLDSDQWIEVIYR